MTDLARDDRRAQEVGLSYGQWRAAQKPSSQKQRDLPEPQNPKRYTEERQHHEFDIARFVELYNLGYSDSEIAAEIDVPREYVYQHRKRLGQQSNKHIPGNMRTPPPQKVKLEEALDVLTPQYYKYDMRTFCEAYNSGMQNAEIAVVVGCSKSAVQRLMKRLSIEPNFLRGGKTRNPYARPLTNEEIEAFVHKWKL